MLKQDGRSHDTLDAERRIARAFNILIFLRLVKDGERMRRVATEVTELHVDEDGKPAVKPLVLWDYERKTWTFTGTSLSAPLRNHLLSRGADPEPFRRLGVWP